MTNGTIAAVFTLPQMTPEQYEQIIAQLEAQSLGAPDGRLSHVASYAAGEWMIVDVWESEEKLQRFAQTLVPIVAGVGVTPPEPSVRPVYHAIP